jgi:hypothetical protein
MENLSQKIIRFGFIFILLFFGSIPSSNAQDTSVLDHRCKREKLLLDELGPGECDLHKVCSLEEANLSRISKSRCHDFENPYYCNLSTHYPCKWIDGQCQVDQCLKYCYSQYCCIEGNTESKIKCLEEYFPGSSQQFGLWGRGGFNMFGSDTVLTCNTIPVIVKAAFAVFFAVFGLTQFITVLRGLNKWLNATFSHEDTKSAKQIFTTGAIGTLVTVGAAFIVGFVFRVAGYKGSLFEFSEDMETLCNIDCKAMTTRESCDKYDWSCSWSDNLCQRSENITKPVLFDKNNPLCQKDKLIDPSGRSCPEITSKF